MFILTLCEKDCWRTPDVVKKVLRYLFLRRRAKRGALLFAFSFWGTSFARCPYGDVFFSQISWHVPIFQTCVANFSKPRTDMVTMFSLKVAQDPRLHFRRKKFSKKIRLHGFFSKEIFKKRYFWLFFIFDPLYLETETEYRVLGFVNCTSVL